MTEARERTPHELVVLGLLEHRLVLDEAATCSCGWLSDAWVSYLSDDKPEDGQRIAEEFAEHMADELTPVLHIIGVLALREAVALIDGLARSLVPAHTHDMDEVAP